MLHEEKEDGQKALGSEGAAFYCPSKRKENRSRSTRGWGATTRREFATSVGAVTGDMAIRLSGLRATGIFASDRPQEAVANVVCVDMKINDRGHTSFIDLRITLADLSREDFGLTGTKKGCDHGQGGACTVLVNGRRINTRPSLAIRHQGDEITAIQGIAKGEELHPIQAAFLEPDGFQCGYSTPGKTCSALPLLKESDERYASFLTANLGKPGPADVTPEEIRERMSGNICRCGAYPGIFQAVRNTYSRHRIGAGEKS